MNIERLQKEADRLDNWNDVEYDAEFNMDDFILESNTCGTACCIGGDVTIANHPDLAGMSTYEAVELIDENDIDCETFAANYLGLNGYQQDWLFYCGFIDTHSLWRDVAPQQAAEAIRLLIKTGASTKEELDELTID